MLYHVTVLYQSNAGGHNKAIDTPEVIDRGYHETIIQSCMRPVFAASLQTRPHESSEEISEIHSELLKKQTLLLS